MKFFRSFFFSLDHLVLLELYLFYIYSSILVFTTECHVLFSSIYLFAFVIMCYKAKRKVKLK